MAATTAALTIIFLAAIVRGYSGFGFSLVAITGLALIYPVSSIVPAIFLMEIALSIFVLAAVALMLKGFKLNAVPGTAAAIAAGGSAGFYNGAFDIAGPPVILFYFSSPAGNAVGRRSFKSADQEQFRRWMLLLLAAMALLLLVKALWPAT